MKIKKSIFILSILCITTLLCASVYIPSVHLKNMQDNSVNVSYINAEMDEDSLVLHVDYDSYGTNFEIIKDIVVATNSEFINPLSEVSCTSNGSQYEYIFDLKERNITDKVYVAPPVVYTPVDIEATSVLPKSGAILRSMDGEAWLTISSLDISEGEDTNQYYITLSVTPHTENVPRLPRLAINGTSVTGHSGMKFDENGEFIMGKMEFCVSANSKEEVETLLLESSLTVDKALLKASAQNANDTTHAKSVRVKIK